MSGRSTIISGRDGFIGFGICVEYQGEGSPYKNQKVAIYCTIVNKALRGEISGPPHKNIYSLWNRHPACYTNLMGRCTSLDPPRIPRSKGDFHPPFPPLIKGKGGARDIRFYAAS